MYIYIIYIYICIYLYIILHPYIGFARTWAEACWPFPKWHMCPSSQQNIN